MDGYTLMSQSQYAREVNVTRTTVNYYVREGQLETEVVGGVPYIKIPKNEAFPKPLRKSKRTT